MRSTDIMATVNGKVKSVKDYIGKNIVSLLALASMCIVLVFICAMNFADMKFDWSRVRNKEFWINYSLLMVLGLVMFALATVFGKSKQKRTFEITALRDALFTLRNYIDDNCLDGDFKLWIANENRKCKLDAYRERTRLIAFFIPFKFRRDCYAAKAKNATLENIDSVSFRFKAPYSSELIFNGIPVRKSDRRKASFTGREGAMGAILPAMMWSMFFQGIILSVLFTGKTSTIDTWIQLLAKVWVMLTFAVKGTSFGVYSISDVYHSVLENRKGMVVEFLATKGINIVIKENENYKFKVVEVKPEDLAINQSEVVNGNN